MILHECPWYCGYFLLSPLRRFEVKPEKALEGLVSPGDVVLDAGCAMGFFSLPLARMVGEEGRVICVDLQERMLKTLMKRAGRAGLQNRIEARRCTAESLGIEDLDSKLDFALAWAVVHETPDQAAFFTQIHKALKASRRLLVAEPAGHINMEKFASTLETAGKTGFRTLEKSRRKKYHAALLEK